MAIELEGRAFPYSLDHGRSYCEVRHEDAVHYIYVYHVGSAFLGSDDFLPEFAEIRGQNGRCYLDHVPLNTQRLLKPFEVAVPETRISLDTKSYYA
jgi:hypothetical protein